MYTIDTEKKTAQLANGETIDVSENTEYVYTAFLDIHGSLVEYYENQELSLTEGGRVSTSAETEGGQLDQLVAAVPRDSRHLNSRLSPMHTGNLVTQYAKSDILVPNDNMVWVGHEYDIYDETYIDYATTEITGYGLSVLVGTAHETYSNHNTVVHIERFDQETGASEFSVWVDMNIMCGPYAGYPEKIRQALFWVTESAETDYEDRVASSVEYLVRYLHYDALAVLGASLGD